LGEIDQIDDGKTMYVPEDTETDLATSVYLVDEEADTAPPRTRYLLEIGIAKEVLAVWSTWRSGRAPSIDEAAAAVIYYARNDAYQPVD
jgi:hypothetical protein